MLEDLRNLENDKLECKTSFRREDIGRTMASFSTNEGGRIYLGVTPKKEMVGIIWNQKIKDNICETARNCLPPVSPSIKEVKHEKERYIVCIKIPKGNGQVYTHGKIPYQRREGINHPLSMEEVKEIQKKRKQLHFDESPARNIERPGLINDLDINKIREYFENANKKVPAEIDMKQFLINNELSINNSGRVINAAIMLFGKDSSKFIPQHRVSISVFPQETEISGGFIKKEIRGTTPEIIKGSFVEVQRNIRNFSFIRGLQRIDVPEYPPEAIREVITNAVVHCDYFIDNTEIFIKIFKDRIEIINSGGFPFAGHSWEEIELSGLSIRRNPILAKFLERLGLMEQEGHGIKRIKKWLKEHGLHEPKIETTENTFKITFFGVGTDLGKIIDSPFGRLLDERSLNSRQIKILGYIKKNPSSNRNECSEILEISERTTSRDLKELVDKGFLRTIGIGKGTRYIAR